MIALRVKLYSGYHLTSTLLPPAQERPQDPLPNTRRSQNQKRIFGSCSNR